MRQWSLWSYWLDWRTGRVVNYMALWSMEVGNLMSFGWRVRKLLRLGIFLNMQNRDIWLLMLSHLNRTELEFLVSASLNISDELLLKELGGLTLLCIWRVGIICRWRLLILSCNVLQTLSRQRQERVWLQGRIDLLHHLWLIGSLVYSSGSNSLPSSRRFLQHFWSLKRNHPWELLLLPGLWNSCVFPWTLLRL